MSLNVALGDMFPNYDEQICNYSNLTNIVIIIKHSNIDQVLDRYIDI